MNVLQERLTDKKVVRNHLVCAPRVPVHPRCNRMSGTDGAGKSIDCLDYLIRRLRIIQFPDGAHEALSRLPVSP